MMIALYRKKAVYPNKPKGFIIAREGDLGVKQAMETVQNRFF